VRAVMRHLVIVTPLLVSCAMITYDVTKDPIAARIAGQCFTLQRDAYVVNTGGIGTKDRLMIPEGSCRGPDGVLTPNGHCRLTVKALIPRGSTLTISQVNNHAEGESGRCWLVIARLTPPDTFEGEVVVPTCAYAQYPQKWLNEWNPETTENPLGFKPDRLLPCVSSPSNQRLGGIDISPGN
jgi:hypothetical protein